MFIVSSGGLWSYSGTAAKYIYKYIWNNTSMTQMQSICSSVTFTHPNQVTSSWHFSEMSPETMEKWKSTLSLSNVGELCGSTLEADPTICCPCAPQLTCPYCKHASPLITQCSRRDNKQTRTQQLFQFVLLFWLEGNLVGQSGGFVFGGGRCLFTEGQTKNSEIFPWLYYFEIFQGDISMKV